MTKKNKYTLAGIIIAVLFIGVSITGEKFPIGTTYLHDSTSSIFTINKNVYIGGDVKVSGLQLRELGGSITEDLDGILSSSGRFTFQTLHENPMMILDSSNGIEMLYGDAKFNYLKVGASSPTFYFKKLKFPVSGSTNSITTMLHGITNYRKISSFEASMWDHAAGVQVMPQSWGGTYLFMARIDSTYLKIYLAAGSTDLVNDTATFLLKIEK